MVQPLTLTPKQTHEYRRQAIDKVLEAIDAADAATLRAWLADPTISNLRISDGLWTELGIEVGEGAVSNWRRRHATR